MANVLVIKQNVYPGFQRIFFSYRYRWFVAKPRQRGAKCRGERAVNINRKHGLFHPRYCENGPLEPGYKMCNLQKNKKNKKTVTWSPQKRSRPALTYHELLSNFIFPLDLDNGARICSACRIALTSSKYKHSAETFVDVSKHDVNNYRPMSVLTPVSKIIGRTIQVQFLAFFNRTRLPVSLTDSGFRTKPHSTETAVVYLTDYILEHMERQMITGVVFIGLKKAFDLVYHECLLFNLEHYGVRGGSLDWFRNYLTTRTQTVQFANDRISTRFNFGVSAFCFVH